MRFIVAARPYAEQRGGHMVLHRLARELQQQGVEVCLKFDEGEEVGSEIPYAQEVRASDVVIYHNSVVGNPWQAQRVIRWMLYADTPQPGEVLYYSPQFGPGPYLNIIDPHLDLFYDRRRRRKGTCWTWRKADRQGAVRPLEEVGTEVVRGMGLLELAEVFNAHTHFVSYDGATWLSVQAALCGCHSLVINPVGGTFPYPGVSCSREEQAAKSREWPLLREKIAEDERTQGARAVRVLYNLCNKQGWE